MLALFNSVVRTVALDFSFQERLVTVKLAALREKFYCGSISIQIFIPFGPIIPHWVLILNK